MRTLARATSILAVTLAAAACEDSPRQSPLAPEAPSFAKAGTGPLAVDLKEIASGLTSPVAIVDARDRSDRLFIVDQIGLIRVLEADGTLRAEPFLDLRGKVFAGGERGLLGLAFHPRYRSNGRFFVYYNAPRRTTGFDNTATFSEFRVSADRNRADPASERKLLQIDDPQGNHNGGTVAFGPDGFLYMSIGDGGGANDCGVGHVDDWYGKNCGGNAQNVEQNLFGKILRIDVDRTGKSAPYRVPASNPFVGKPGLDEIYAYGFRNPYRFSFDLRTGRLFVGDAGQNRWEEVSLVRRGGNYGWNVKEGTHCFDAQRPGVPPAQCPSVVESGVRKGDRLIDPIIEYANAAQPGGLGRTVIGGVVYRGRELRQLDGSYVFGDWSRNAATPDGTLFVASERKNRLWQMQELTIATSPNGRINHYVLGFGQDGDGEVYVGARQSAASTGKVFKLVRPDGQ